MSSEQVHCGGVLDELDLDSVGDLRIAVEVGGGVGGSCTGVTDITVSRDVSEDELEEELEVAMSVRASTLGAGVHAVAGQRSPGNRATCKLSGSTAAPRGPGQHQPPGEAGCSKMGICE